MTRHLTRTIALNVVVATACVADGEPELQENTMYSILRRGLVATALTLATLTTHADSGVMVKDSWVREMPPGTTNAAAYLVLHNHSAIERELIGASTDVAERVELHTTENNDGTLRMKHIAGVVVPSGGMAALAPGAEHVMLIGVSERLVAGQQVQMTLQFANGESQSANFEVKRGKAMDHHGSGGHDAHKSHEHGHAKSDG